MGLRKNRIPRPPSQAAQRGDIILIARRGEAGSVIVHQQADMEVDEFAAVMEGMTDLAKAIGWQPGDIAAAHARLMNHKRGLEIANRNGTHGTDGTGGGDAA